MFGYCWKECSFFGKQQTPNTFLLNDPELNYSFIAVAAAFNFPLIFIHWIVDDIKLIPVLCTHSVNDDKYL